MVSQPFLVKFLAYKVESTVESNGVAGFNESIKNIVDIRDYKKQAKHTQVFRFGTSVRFFRHVFARPGLGTKTGYKIPVNFESTIDKNAVIDIG